MAAVGLLCLGRAAVQDAEAAGATGKIPITTSSEEARRLYLEGRDLAEKLRATDAHALYEQAAAKDKDFALARLGLANTAASAREFFERTSQAVALADKASEGERLLILGQDAGAKGQVARQGELYRKLTELFPNDERGHNVLGGYLFAQQDYPASIAAYQKAVAINPAFSQPYNQLGYAHRFMENYKDAEAAFKKYIELIPGDPNPYDSYAELLMKTGRFEESIKTYEKALAVDPNFIASWIGIGNDHIFLGRGEEARNAFARLQGVARNDGERRQAFFWSAVSYVHEGKTAEALAEVKKEYAVAEAGQDLAAMAGDLNFMGNILLEADRPDEALAQFQQQLATIAKADVPAEVKEAARRNALFDEARVALAKGDRALAHGKAEAYAREAATKGVPFELRRQHELRGQIALAEKDWRAAVSELDQAGQQDPRVLYLLAVALREKGDAGRAREVCTRAANFNALANNYAFVRAKARVLLASVQKKSDNPLS